jgi:hypothetical protein
MLSSQEPLWIDWDSPAHNQLLFFLFTGKTNKIQIKNIPKCQTLLNIKIEPMGNE